MTLFCTLSVRVEGIFVVAVLLVVLVEFLIDVLVFKTGRSIERKILVPKRKLFDEDAVVVVVIEVVGFEALALVFIFSTSRLSIAVAAVVAGVVSLVDTP